MKLPIFSTAGEALNFGARRMETIMRVAWLPVLLLLIVDMTAVFAALSIANDRFISFADVPKGMPFQNVAALGLKATADFVAKGDVRMIALLAATGVFNTMLVASLMAPLIRLAGLGEKPAPGVLRLPFGPDQLRYIGAGLASFVLLGAVVLAPVFASASFILGQINSALSKTYVVFPDKNSLHAVDYVAADIVLGLRDKLWIFSHGLWFAGAAALSVFAVALYSRHFLKVGAVGGAALGVMARFFGAAALISTTLFIYAALSTGNFKGGFIAEATAIVLFQGAAALLLLYATLRFAAYQGVAVCRRSMAPAGVLKVTEGTNFWRLAAVLALVGGVIFAAAYFIEKFIIGWAALASVNFLYVATETVEKLLNSGERSEWVLPFFLWVWTGLKIIYKVFWTFFTYGVAAGLAGRLYRESLRSPSTPQVREVWRRDFVAD